MSTEVPVDLITQILQILPVKTLLRFKCFCKSIRDIIDSPDFINSHLNRTHRNLIFRESLPLSSTFSLFGGDDGYIPRVLVFDIDNGLLQSFDMNDDEFQPEVQNLPSYKFYAHCNGLILLGEDLYNLGVWNPSTRKYKKLPPFPLSNYPDHIVSHSITGLGFAYDSCSDDYNVILIEEVSFKDCNVYFKICILGLMRSCYWRKIRNSNPCLRFISFKQSSIIEDGRICFVDGAFHFRSGIHHVYALDVTKKSFSEVDLPEFDEVDNKIYNDKYVYPFKLQVFEGCLCISFIRLNRYERVRELNLYVREKKIKDVGVEFCWTKLYSSTNEEHFEVLSDGLLGYSKERDKIFILDDQHSSLYSYDVEEKNLQRIEIGMEDVFTTLDE